jgi:hypothetical protein
MLISNLQSSSSNFTKISFHNRMVVGFLQKKKEPIFRGGDIRARIKAIFYPREILRTVVESCMYWESVVECNRQTFG